MHLKLFFYHFIQIDCASSIMDLGSRHGRADVVKRLDQPPLDVATKICMRSIGVNMSMSLLQMPYKVEFDVAEVYDTSTRSLTQCPHHIPGLESSEPKRSLKGQGQDRERGRKGEREKERQREKRGGYK
jgi:hypothetical protein